VANVTDASGTYPIYGVFTSQEGVDFTAPTFTLHFEWFNVAFNQSFFVPEALSEIVVKYDNRIPVRVFGGDTWINESTWAVKDKVYNKGAEPVNDVVDDGLNGAGDLFRLNLAFPYREWELNPRIFIVNKTTGVNKIQDGTIFKFDDSAGLAPASIRQLIAMWTAETRINLSFAFNDEVVKHSTDQYFAAKNYVMRPYNWKDGKFGDTAAEVYEDNNLQPDYETDYGDEFNLWGQGGFRFKPQTNIDYSKRDNTKKFTSVPRLGFEEQNLYCSRVIWSEERPVNIQDSPSVRTFSDQNTYDLSDDTGEIKFAWSADSAKGNNLYAFTDSGIALLLVDKRIVSEINANELATVSSDIGGILQELWLEREIGMGDEMWRTAGEYNNRLYFTNYNSAYMFTNNTIKDIGRMGYHSKLYPEFLENFDAGYDDHVTGVYDILHDEYWVNFKKVPNTPESSFDFITRLYLVDDIFGSGNYAGQYYGAAENETVTVTVSTDLPTQVGLVLGGYPDNDMMSKRICVKLDESSPFPLRVTDSNFTELLIMQQGECYCFTPVFSFDAETQLPTRDVIGFTFEVCPVDSFGDCPTLVWGENVTNPNQSAWQGAFSYDFDKYLSFNNKSYGMRNLETYLLDEGRIINGELIDAHVVTGSAKSSMTKSYASVPVSDKEFIRFRANSSTKPVRVEFFTLLEQYLNDDPQALLDTVANPLALKDYFGYEQYIPRKTLAPHDRMQGRLLIFKIIHNLDEDFRLSSSDIQYKPLK
jgi:hypothetical protein